MCATYTKTNSITAEDSLEWTLYKYCFTDIAVIL